MCPLRFILVFFSALLAGYVAWRTVRSSPEDLDFTTPDDETTTTQKQKQESDGNFSKFQRMIQNGFWGFVDMASGKYLWRNLKSLQNVDKVKSC